MTAVQGESNHVKVIFEIENEKGSVEIESVWAVPVANGYQIDNIPFYAKGIACYDIVGGEPDLDGMLRFTGLVKASGHSTIRLWFENEADVARVRETLRGIGCPSELDLPRLVAVDIPPPIPYERIRAYLDQQEAAGILNTKRHASGKNDHMGENQ